MRATMTRSLLGISCVLLLGCGVKPLEVIMETDGGADAGGGQSGGSGGAQGGSGGSAGGSGGAQGGSGGSAGGSGGASGGSGGGSGGSAGGSGGASGGTGGGVHTGGTGGTIQVGVGQSCDGFRPPPIPVCQPSLFCEHPAGSCGIADGTGTCVAVTPACDLILAPVCGCDGKTYPNDCARRNARVQLNHKGECKRGLGAMCGGIAGFQCDTGLFCDQTPGMCGVADAAGTCQRIPNGCEKNLAPVCGCDGMTYGNDCMRQAAKVPKRADGACKARQLQAGQWGTTGQPDANLLVKDPAFGGVIEFGCANGTIQGPLDVGEEGGFKWPGTWVSEAGARPIPPPLGRDVVYTGKVSGDTMVLTVVFPNAGVMHGPYTLTLGKQALLIKCQ